MKISKAVLPARIPPTFTIYIKMLSVHRFGALGFKRKQFPGLCDNGCIVSVKPWTSFKKNVLPVLLRKYIFMSYNTQFHNC